MKTKFPLVGLPWAGEEEVWEIVIKDAMDSARTIGGPFLGHGETIKASDSQVRLFGWCAPVGRTEACGEDYDIDGIRDAADDYGVSSQMFGLFSGAVD